MATALRNLYGQTAFRLCVVLWTFGGIVLAAAMASLGRLTSLPMALSIIPLMGCGVALSMLLAGLVNRFESRAISKWIFVILGIAVAGLAQTAIDDLWNRMLALTVFPSWQSWALSSDPQKLFTVFLLYTWTFALAVALIWSARTNDMARMNEARAAAFEAAASRAEAAALRLQLNPHFLFNTLNGIASLVVRRKTHQAEEMIGRLAEFLRSSLAADPTALIPLNQELATARAYLHIEEARFGDRMRVIWNVDEASLETAVPNFLLQPLIENAVKHGVARSRRRTIIEVDAGLENGSLILSVTNRECGAERTSLFPRVGEQPLDAGMGLSNTRQRVTSLYGEAAWVKTHTLPRGYRCEIGLPPVTAEPRLVAAE